MPARLLHREKIHRSDGVVVEIVVWEVEPRLAGSGHDFKYRLYAGRAGRTLVRYDNEPGKGDHKHMGANEREVAYAFESMARTLRDFLDDVERLSAQTPEL